MKHILLIGNIDGQDAQLLRYAAKFCNAKNLRMHVLQIEENTEPIILSSPYYYNKMGFVASQEFYDKKKQLEMSILHASKDLIDATWVSNKIVRGNIEHVLKTFINQEKIDLILVGQSVFTNTSDEHSIFKQILLNVSEIPSLIIPANRSYKPFVKTAYLTTLKGDDYDHMSWVKTNFSEANIDVLHFSENEVSVEGKKKINYLKSELGDTSFRYENKKEDIEDFIRRETSIVTPEYDLITLRTRKRNFWNRLFDPSTALNLILKIDTPTLLFKYQENERGTNNL